MLTGIVLILSGITDLLDGYIARKYDAVSDLGKILDPVADKLTQIAMLLCLVTRFPLIWLPLCLMLFKEVFMMLSGLCIIKRSGQVLGADWHGKAATALLYAVMILHVFWVKIPHEISAITIIGCAVMIIISFVFYGIRNVNALKVKKV